MRTRRQATLDELRLAIRTLPRRTRIAMLEGLDANEIIVGAYATSDGICPMLAAHRNGGRTAAISFAHAWDRVAFRSARDTQSRRATERELLILRSHLEASLLDDDVPADDLGAARRDHERLLAAHGRKPADQPDGDVPARANPSATPRPGDPNRAPELQRRHGWAWTRIFRRYDDYERALARLEETARAVERDAEPVA